ncbi:MAG TPA: ferritin-like protein [Puia sp.]|nr:ferritin-like protein [Puia sp.]
MKMEMKYSQPKNENRQNLTSTDYKSWGLETNPIDSPAKLRKKLQDAIKIELATIPPYLTALYSIVAGTNRVATGIIRSVAMEEMLHLCLAANLLNAVGGEPVIDHSTTLDYPDFLPENSNRFKVGLVKFSPEAINTFLDIERPVKDSRPPEGDKFRSIGQFYLAVLKAMEDLGAGIFIEDHSKQITSDHYYGSGGKIVPVTNLKTARQAVNEIIGQGEGIDHTIEDGIPGNFGDEIELAHYFRFNEIKEGRKYRVGDNTQDPPSGEPVEVDWGAVYNMKPNPRLTDYDHNPQLAEQARNFNKTYADLLRNIHSACNGCQDDLKKAIPLMYELKYQAIGLMKTPIGQGELTAGPTFEPVTA